MDINNQSLKKMSGITLIELLTVIAIVGIFASVAVPQFSAFITSMRLTTQANDFVADLRFARSEAGARGRRVLICPSTNGTSCSTNAADWARGRIVFIDANLDGDFQVAETKLKVSDGLSGDSSVSASGFTSVALGFNPYGGLMQDGALGGSGTMKICSSSSSTGRQIRIDATGRPGASKANCS